MANFTATHWIALSGATATGTSRLTWSSTVDVAQSGPVIDMAPLGQMDASDTFLTAHFTGFYLAIDGHAFGVFRNGHTYAVPYNKDIHDIWGSAALTSGVTTSYLMPLPVAANCFLQGTRIATPQGPRRIETLGPGDLVSLAFGPPAPILWTWHQTLPNLPQTAPLIRLCAHSLGPGIPASDLVVTPDHAIGLDGLLVTARALVNGASIHEVAYHDLSEHYTLWHLEIADHCLLLAQGCPAESFLDYGGRHRFAGHDAYLRRHGHDRLIPEMPLPRITSARQLSPALRARLGLDRAA